jgi:hypothetical protein
VIAENEFVVLPRGASLAELKDEPSISLGGVFYDYWVAPNGGVAGIRYYSDVTDLYRHPVYSQFIKDDRFVFEQGTGQIDFVFDVRDAQSLRDGLLALDVVQDFGDDRVVRSGAFLGIAISLYYAKERGVQT